MSEEFLFLDGVVSIDELFRKLEDGGGIGGDSPFTSVLASIRHFDALVAGIDLMVDTSGYDTNRDAWNIGDDWDVGILHSVDWHLDVGGQLLHIQVFIRSSIKSLRMVYRVHHNVRKGRRG